MNIYPPPHTHIHYVIGTMLSARALAENKIKISCCPSAYVPILEQDTKEFTI